MRNGILQFAAALAMIIVVAACQTTGLPQQSASMPAKADLDFSNPDWYLGKFVGTWEYYGSPMSSGSMRLMVTRKGDAFVGEIKFGNTRNFGDERRPASITIDQNGLHLSATGRGGDVMTMTLQPKGDGTLVSTSAYYRGSDKLSHFLKKED